MTKKNAIFIVMFFVLWLSPLLLPTGLYRYALEEIRVLAVGLGIGYLIAKTENQYKEVT